VALELSFHPLQQKIYNDTRRFKVISCGRRFGKSIYASQVAIIEGLRRKNGEIILVSPTFSQTQIIYNMIMKRLPEQYIKSKSVAEKYVELISGTRIYAKSGDNPDSMRGYGPFLVILDEAAMLKEEVWKEVLRPALADNKGSAIIISTPKGKNWFYEIFGYGQSTDPQYKDYAAYQYSSYDNPFLDPKELDEMAMNLPEIVYNQEIQAQFIEGGGVVFRTFTEVLKDCLDCEESDEDYVGGADLGRREDFTVISIMKRRTREIVYLERFNKLDWDYIKSRVTSVSKQYNNATIFLDSTGMGDPIYEDLAKQGVNVRGVKISSSSKPTMINALSIMIENKQIWLPNDTELKKEFQSYTYTMTPEGNVKYGAPPGMHDDIVMSIALLAYGVHCYTECIGMIEPEPVEEESYWNEDEENFIDWEEDVECIDDAPQPKWKPLGFRNLSRDEP
jgi:phage FluMu gp28-like protein